MGPPTCGTGGTPGVTIGQTCMSPIRAAKGITDLLTISLLKFLAKDPDGVRLDHFRGGKLGERRRDELRFMGNQMAPLEHLAIERYRCDAFNQSRLHDNFRPVICSVKWTIPRVQYPDLRV